MFDVSRVRAEILQAETRHRVVVSPRSAALRADERDVPEMQHHRLRIVTRPEPPWGHSPVVGERFAEAVARIERLAEGIRSLTRTGAVCRAPVGCCRVKCD